MRYRVLGPLEVGDGEALPNRRKQRLLLALLLFHANTVVRTSFLLDALWDGRQPVSASANLQSYIAGLRQLVGKERLETQHGGYVLRVAEGELDATSFTELATAGSQLLEAGDHAGAVERLTSALALWRGTVLDGLPLVDALQREAERLDDARTRALEDRVEARLELGQHAEAAAELRALVAQHPFRERIWRLLMLALYRSGRQNEALDAYQRMRQSFVDQLGIEPGSETRRLHQRILTADSALDPRQVLVRPRMLPPDVAHLVGRGDELDLLDTVVADRSRARLSAVVGPAGFGKTSLAVRWAHRVAERFPDGQLFLDLRGHDTGSPMRVEQALTQCLRVLGTPSTLVPVTVDEQVAMYRSLLANRKMLVVLDNAASAEQCRPLLPSAPGCAVIVTSRNDLRGLAVVNDATIVRLDVLGAREAHDLLCELLDTDIEPDSIAELAQLCGYLPLALRIAAANLVSGQYPAVSDYVTALREGDRMAELAIEGDPDVAVRATFDLSYRALDAGTRRMFRLLGAAPGLDFTVHAVAAAGGVPPARARRLLDTLVAANLLVQRGNRYQFHDLIREFAAGRAHEEDSPATRHTAGTGLLSYYLETADRAVGLLYPGTRRLEPLPAADLPATSPLDTETAALRWLDTENYNLVAAVKRAAEVAEYHTYAWQLTDALRGYLQARGHAGDGLAICAAAQEAARRSGDHLAEASMLDLRGLIHYNLGDYQAAIDQHTMALEVTRRSGDVHAETDCLHNLGRVYSQLGLPGPAMRYHEQALALSRQSGNLDAEALALNYVGAAHLSFGDAVEAFTWHQLAHALSRRMGNRYTQARALNGLGLCSWTLGDLTRAAEYHRESLALCIDLGHRHSEVVALVCLAETYCDAGRYDEAAALAHDAITKSVQLGNRRNEASGLELVATVRQRRGDNDGAVIDYVTALELARRIGFGYGETSILIGLAEAHRGRGEPHIGRTYAEQALAKIRKSGMRVLEAQATTTLAHCQVDLGDLDQAESTTQHAITLARQGHQRLVEARALQVGDILQRIEHDQRQPTCPGETPHSATPCVPC
ncbi:AfsR/SARP family transcriptional regulator [Actinophytocola algeriensis]|uniref:DNA-binding SARP family transcriptional activator/Tfp pilus assembly protein PilF n=1 Tax=Actinophytocola algeriensis TaxID=1768010 RepID=A0A7W7VFR2_9PSEU|nr:BTAD domain-containing putative transcriptional regulator [Actinophytocola algeriensis]MBB4908265.1 DNA-binding SARP family transcriptional activator/Tfp pilus assembly protein PilF [Actinophytocola algeriensis]MBE1480295.1 DNA-binding SARP family transcriptional activator [Actinophytocola algeriensis]